MDSILTFAEQMLVDRLNNNKTILTAGDKIKGFWIVFSAVTALISVGFLSYAAYLWLSTYYSPTIVMASMGGLALAFSVIGAIISFVMIEYRYIKMKKMKSEFVNMAEKAIHIFEKEISQPVNDNPKSAILVSVIAGYFAGNRF